MQRINSENIRHVLGAAVKTRRKAVGLRVQDVPTNMDPRSLYRIEKGKGSVDGALVALDALNYEVFILIRPKNGNG